jgi:hypothetical protein
MCRCHLEEQSFLNDQPLDTTPSNDDIGPIMVSPKNASQREYSPPPNLTPPQALPTSSTSSKPTPGTDSKRSSSVSNSSNNMKTIKPESTVTNKGNNNKDAISQKNSEIGDKLKKKSSTVNIQFNNKKSEISKETKLDTESVRSEDEKRGPKGMRRMSKYSEALKINKVIYTFILNKDVDIIDVMKGKKSESSKKIISFRSKSKDKNSVTKLITLRIEQRLRKNLQAIQMNSRRKLKSL